MRSSHAPRSDRPGALRQRIEPLAGLPLRPATARHLLALQDEAGQQATPGHAEDPSSTTANDPGYALGRVRSTNGSCDPLALVAEQAWWQAPQPGAQAEAIEQLWRHAVAASCAARRLARQAGVADPEPIARAALLHNLDYWAIAAVAPERLVPLLETTDPRERRQLERTWLGSTAGELARDLAERWGCEPLVVAAAWLHDPAESVLAEPGCDPDALALVHQAIALAECTPWALAPARLKQPWATEPLHRLLVAEVQAQCGSTFVDPTATVHEERLAQAHARLRIQMNALVSQRRAETRLIEALGSALPGESPAVWAERAASAWQDEPGAAEAEVAWAEAEAASATGALGDRAEAGSSPKPTPALILPLGSNGRRLAEIRLWAEPGAAAIRPPSDSLLRAWSSWAESVAQRERQAQRLSRALETLRQRAEGEEASRRAGRLDALAEFAAGAGHELNNPLAVIVGRAQLLLGRQRDADGVRSLRAIIGQAQRAHRILRDLMYVARPPAPRARLCQPDEIVRACLRDLQSEAEARGVRMVAECAEAAPLVWADPDPLRHLADCLVRNSLEATPAGGTIRVRSRCDGEQLDWCFEDTGRGLSVHEAQHLFDPFFCGRQAGRGLGLGLPRAARFVAMCGGELRWSSAPGRGSTFQLNLPLEAPPQPAPQGQAPAHAAAAAAAINHHPEARAEPPPQG